MSKITIDIDKINKDLIPNAKTQKSNVLNALIYAKKVNFPNGDFNWGDISSKLDDCVSNSDKYLQWIEGQSRKFSNNINNIIEDVSLIDIEEVKKNNIIVN
jgi:hypothetical protein